MDNIKTIQIFIRKNSLDGCKIIAASKTRTKIEIIKAKEAGITHFGENYVKEAMDKFKVFNNCKLHLIGYLQSNKCKEAVKHFDYIHSVDRIKLAKSLEKECIKQGRGELKIFIQVNQTSETSKGGVLIVDLNSLITYIRENCPHLNCIGLMAIPPKNCNSEKLFLELKKLANNYNLKELSIGMSSDYEQAITSGATYIRIGSAIFGSR